MNSWKPVDGLWVSAGLQLGNLRLRFCICPELRPEADSNPCPWLCSPCAPQQPPTPHTYTHEATLGASWAPRHRRLSLQPRQWLKQTKNSKRPRMLALLLGLPSSLHLCILENYSRKLSSNSLTAAFFEIKTIIEVTLSHRPLQCFPAPPMDPPPGQGQAAMGRPRPSLLSPQNLTSCRQSPICLHTVSFGLFAATFPPTPAESPRPQGAAAAAPPRPRPEELQVQVSCQAR